MNYTKTEYACPCCNGPIVHLRSNGGKTHILHGFNGNGNDLLGRYRCNYCDTSIPWELLVLPTATRAITAPRFICTNHGGCQSCHRAFARYVANFWLSEAMQLERYEPRTASLCESCLRDIMNTCRVKSPVQEIRGVMQRYRYLAARRAEVEKARTRKLLSVWASRKNRLTKSRRNSILINSIGTRIIAYPSAIRIRKCPKCGKRGYLDTETRKCGHKNCRCRRGMQHGPYFGVHHQSSRKGPQSICYLNRAMLAKIESEVKD